MYTSKYNHTHRNMANGKPKASMYNIIAYNYHHNFKTHGMICDIIIFEHPFNSTKTKIINKSTFKDLMNPLKKVLS